MAFTQPQLLQEYSVFTAQMIHIAVRNIPLGSTGAQMWVGEKQRVFLYSQLWTYCGSKDGDSSCKTCLNSK